MVEKKTSDQTKFDERGRRDVAIKKYNFFLEVFLVVLCISLFIAHYFIGLFALGLLLYAKINNVKGLLS